MELKKAETKRFLDVVDALIKGGYASNDSDLKRKTDLGNSTLTEIRKGRAAVTMPTIQKLVKTFSLNIDYILNGTGEIFKTDTKAYPDGTVSTPNQVAEGMAKYKKSKIMMDGEFIMDTIRKCQEQLDRSQQQIGKSQEQIDRLIGQGDRQLSIIEVMAQKVKQNNNDAQSKDRFGS